MSDFKIILVAEANELKRKIDKLESFINSDNFNNIDELQAQLLIIQLNSMKSYFSTLNLRAEILDSK